MRGADAVTSPAMDAPVADDGGLMLAWAGGNAAAFDQLYVRHKGPLYRFLLKTVKDRAIADELFQETWSRVIGARSRYRPEATFRTWLLQIAHNLAVDSFRRHRPQAGVEETEAVFAAQAAPMIPAPITIASERPRALMSRRYRAGRDRVRRNGASRRP